jgi:hypothetical protein
MRRIHESTLAATPARLVVRRAWWAYLPLLVFLALGCTFWAALAVARRRNPHPPQHPRPPRRVRARARVARRAAYRADARHLELVAPYPRPLQAGGAAGEGIRRPPLRVVTRLLTPEHLRLAGLLAAPLCAETAHSYPSLRYCEHRMQFHIVIIDFPARHEATFQLTGIPFRAFEPLVETELNHF